MSPGISALTEAGTTVLRGEVVVAATVFAVLVPSAMAYGDLADGTPVADNIADESLRRITKQRWISIGVNSIAVVVALIAPVIAVGLHLIQKILMLVFPLVGMRRHHVHDQE